MPTVYPDIVPDEQKVLYVVTELIRSLIPPLNSNNLKKTKQFVVKQPYS